MGEGVLGGRRLQGAAARGRPTARGARDTAARAPRVATRLPRVIAMLAALVGLAASATLLGPLLGGAQVCDAGGGCDVVAQSAYATVLGVPRAALGIAAFGALLVLASAGRPFARRLAPVVGIVGAVEGVRLLLLQAFVLHTFCRFCVVADLAAIAAGIALVYDRARARHPGAIAPRAAAIVAAIAIAGPIGLAALTRPPAPGTSPATSAPMSLPR